MDFSWVKELAEKDNFKEVEKYRKERRDKEEKRNLALSTVPLVEKICLILTTCAEEFNKYAEYPHLKITTTRLQRRIRSVINEDDPELKYEEETASFTFGRNHWVFGIRGANGVIEFLELPGATDSSQLNFKLDDAAVAASRKIVAKHDGSGTQIVWEDEGQSLNGEALLSLCKDYFREFIEKTN